MTTVPQQEDGQTDNISVAILHLALQALSSNKKFEG